MESHIKICDTENSNDTSSLNMDSLQSSLGEKCISVEDLDFQHNHQKGEEPDLMILKTSTHAMVDSGEKYINAGGSESHTDHYEEVEIDKEEPEVEVPGNLIPTTKALGRSLNLDNLTFPSKSRSGIWVQVPRELIFVESCLTNFEAKIRISNPSKWIVSYCVCSSSPKHFGIRQKVGCIPPQGIAEILVFVDISVTDFAGFCRDMFVVLATPIYFQSQTQPKKIKLLWKVFGTNAFPYTSAEAHKIDRILPRYDHFLEKTQNMLRMAWLGNYISLKEDIKEVVFPLERSVDELDFYDNCRPTEPDHEISICLLIHFDIFEIILKQKQILDWHASLRSLKHRIRSIRTNQSTFNFSMGVTAFLLLGPSMWTHCCEFMSIVLEFGSNGQPLIEEDLVETKSWWFF